MPDGPRAHHHDSDRPGDDQLKTRAIEKVVEGPVNLIMTGRKTGQAYYVKAWHG